MKIAYHMIVKIIVGSIIWSILSSSAAAGGKGEAILYWQSGGIANMADTILTIDSNGVAYCLGMYPVITHQLSNEQTKEIFSWFEGFDTLADTYNGPHDPCPDLAFPHLEYRHDTSLKKIVFGQCGYDKDNIPPAVLQLTKIVQQLLQVEDSLVGKFNTWNGIKAAFRLNKLVFGIHEPIRLTITLSNPTSLVRTLYFRNKYQFSFTVNGTFPNIFQFQYPVYGRTDTSGPTQITLEPGSHQELTHLWDYSTDTSLHVIPGTYTMYAALPAGTYEDGFQSSPWLTFDIADSSMPIGGKAWVDTSGTNNYEQYRFVMTVQNWTTKPVALHFSNSRTVSLKLFFNTLEPKNLLYEDTVAVDGEASTVTLDSNEIKDFSCRLPGTIKDIIKKSNRGGNYLRCILTLLPREYSFKRETGIMTP